MENIVDYMLEEKEALERMGGGNDGIIFSYSSSHEQECEKVSVSVQ